MIASSAKNYFNNRDYGCEVGEIIILWSAFSGLPLHAGISKGTLTIPIAAQRDFVVETVPPKERLDYLVRQTLERVSQDAPRLRRRGFAVDRFLEDLTHYFHDDLPRKIASAEEPEHINFEKF